MFLLLALVFLVVPLRARTQAPIDRLFFRHAYDAQDALGALSRDLAAVESFEAVSAAAAMTLAMTLSPAKVELRLRTGDGNGNKHFPGGPHASPSSAV